MGLYCFHLASKTCELSERRWFDSDALAFGHAMDLMVPGACVEVRERSRHVASLWGEALGFPSMMAPREWVHGPEREGKAVSGRRPGPWSRGCAPA